MSLAAITPREASIFACVTDAVVAPEPLLPAVRHTDTVLAFDRWLAHSPRPNRFGLRALLYAVELSPWLAGHRRRLRRLEPVDRAHAIGRAEHAGPALVRGLFKLVKGLCTMCYYGDPGVARQLGYDADANALRGRELRAREGRP